MGQSYSRFVVVCLFLTIAFLILPASVCRGVSPSIKRGPGSYPGSWR